MATGTEEYARPAQPPDTSSLAELRDVARECKACHLYKRATQTVFGEGPKDAAIMLVGEQPGDYEDQEGKPFVGPAGKIMDQALEEAGIDRKEVYVTNAVKHFKWEPRWKAPDSSETKFARNRSVSAVAGSGAAPCDAKVAGVSRRDGSADGFRSIIPCYSRTRQGIIIETCAENPRHGASIVSSSTTGRGIAATRV